MTFSWYVFHFLSFWCYFSSFDYVLFCGFPTLKKRIEQKREIGDSRRLEIMMVMIAFAI